ncbi:arrestin domain-containing protein 3-like isoform X2 [Silurus meridionalis]|uniref:arrestin domain-containing protein 3-like isoform X2 n=1 Tax=Silurus meridionalis TaxID=175797 RepID=UPI001EEA6C50|nr:arrestin domain-containing protein 3-like isoform X2 [Silurus meridionalis]
MACKVKSLSVRVNPVNLSNTFTTGDYITGRVTLEVVKKTHIQSLLIDAKGEANVQWTERQTIRNYIVYSAKEMLFKSVHYFIEEQMKGDDGYSLLTNENGQCYSRIVEPGIHVYPFTFQLPYQDMPPSFKGYHGAVKYFLEAKLCRSMLMTKKAKVYFNYVPQGDLTIPNLMTPQNGYKEKKMKIFTSGNVTMDVHLEKMGFLIDEQMKVKIDVGNNSSRTVTPKFLLYQKQSFFAGKKRSLRTKEILKELGDPIEPSTEQCVTKMLNIPADTSISILNCKVLKVEYRLKVYLDIKFTSDPEIKLPVVILPVSVKHRDVPKPDMGVGFEPT